MRPADGDQVAELLAHPGVEERLELAGRFGFLAFHGGLEGGTEVVAERAAAASGSSLYVLEQPPTLRWHLPSHVVGAGASPALTRFLDHVDLAIAVHGFGRRARPHDILVGGANRELAALLAARLRVRLPTSVVVDDLRAIPPEMRGLHPDNPVNRCRRGGVQLELPPDVRGASWRWEDRGGPCRPEPALVDALAEVAEAASGQSTSNVPPDLQ